MAGKRQHFIPQFLQRGFASHYIGDEAFTWVYRKDTPPFNTNIKNVGVEGYFYSMDGDIELDRSITDLEETFSDFTFSLRSQNSKTIKNSEKIAKLLAHLEIRTRHLRQSLLETGSFLMDELLKYVSDEEVFGRFFQREIQNNPSLMKDAITKEMKKRGIPIENLPYIMEHTGPLLGKVLPKTMSTMSRFAVHFRDSLPQRMNEIAKSGHIKALAGTLAPEPKVNRFKELQFHIISNDRVSLPLGDSIVLFHVKGKSPFKPFLEGKDELLGVFLPLSPQQVLVGSKGEYDFDISRLSREIVRCSLEHFISSKPPTEYENLLPFMSQNAHLLSSAQIKNMVDELINGETV